MKAWLKVGLGVAMAAGAFFYLNYLPFRKAVHRLDPRWKRDSKPLEFSHDQEVQEEENLFVSSTIMRDACDVIWREKSPQPPPELFSELPYGTVVFVNLFHMRRFVAEVLPHLRSEIVLVAGCDTRSPKVPGYEQLYEDPRILHAFIQNCDFSAPAERVTHLPLGLNFHKLDPSSDNQSRDMGLPSRPGNQQLTLKALREKVGPLSHRPLRVYANFHLNMDIFLRDGQARKRRDARAEAYEILKEKSFVWLEKKQQPRNVVWSRYPHYAFEASPRGNGWDCHRTYEAILFKTIPIVQHSPIDPVYEGLPVALVHEWSEVTPERMKEWVEQFAPYFEQPIPDQLYSSYWIERFRSFRAG